MNSEVAQKITWINERLEEEILFFSNKRRENRILAVRYHIFVSILGVVVTIILGLKIDGFNEYSRVISLIISGIITILNTISIFFNYKGIWIRYTQAQNELYKIKDDFNFYLQGKDEGDVDLVVVGEFKLKFDSALDMINEEWMKIRK